MPIVSRGFRSSLPVAPWIRGRRGAAIAVVGATTVVCVLGALGPAGCLGTCTLKGCSPGFDVVITGPQPESAEPEVDPRLRAAVYRIEARVDGGELHVECTFDDAGEGTCEEATWVTEPTRALDAGVVVVTDDDEGPLWGQGILIHFGGSSDARFGINEYGPDMVELTVTRDGEEVASASFTPEYEVLEDFNGKGCGDCEVARQERVYVEPA